MLTPSQIELVKATIPVLQEYGVLLTTHFYARMFRDNPELKQIFNRGHQEAGQQQHALAGAVLAYAQHIENPGVLAPVLTRIANKHVSLGIRAEHYPIVGGHLLASIREVLGDAASDELIDAWAAAYGQLADALIAEESSLFSQSALKRGGWTGWRAFKLMRKVAESEEITSFYLQPADQGPVPDYLPGQYISARVFVPEWNLMQPRQYSLSDAPGGDMLRISVKRETAGETTPAGRVSNLLHDAINEGDLIDLAPPCGDFFLHTERNTPVVLISAGVGLTPMLSMLNHLVKTQSPREIRFLHATRNGKTHAMRNQVNRIAAECDNVAKVVFYETIETSDVAGCDYDHGGRMDLAAIAAQAIQPDADYYLCGPLPFMRAQHAALLALGVQVGRIHAELFGTGGL